MPSDVCTSTNGKNGVGRTEVFLIKIYKIGNGGVIS